MKIHRSLAVGVGLGLLAPLVAPGAAGAELPEVVTAVKARDWLVTQQQADGGFEVAGFPGFETADAVVAIGSVGDGAWDPAEALAAVESVQSGGNDALDAIDDLVDGEADPLGVAAWARAAKVTALVAQPLGLDASAFDPSDDSVTPVDLLARIDSRRNGDGSFDFGAQFNGALYTAIALSGEGGGVPAALVEQIRAGQRSDGSWDYTGTTTADGEDIDTTSLALIALRSSGIAKDDPAVAAAVAWLAARQQANGSWQAFGADDPNATAMATLALSDLRIDVSTSGWRAAAGVPASGGYTSPIAWLSSQQAADGHIASAGDLWGVNTFATSQSMQAIGQQWYLHAEYQALLDAFSAELASPAAAEGAGHAGDALGQLGPNPSNRARRLAGAAAVVTGQAGREAAVGDLYQAAFGRSLDPSGRAYWGNKLVTLSRPEVLARLTGSNEYFRKAGGTFPAFVDKVYQSVLGRGPDPSGRAFWIRQLENGRSVQAVARSLTASNEYRRLQARTAYQRVLDREPTTAERDYWTANLAKVRVEVLLAVLGSSAEKYDSLAG